MRIPKKSSKAEKTTHSSTFFILKEEKYVENVFFMIDRRFIIGVSTLMIQKIQFTYSQI